MSVPRWNRPTETHPAALTAPLTNKPHHDEERAAQIPQRLGRYDVRQLLGEGGFGAVYLAHDNKLDRLVAVKVPHVRCLADPDDAALYLREARLVAQLDHPHIVPVFDVGSTPEIPLFVVSKYIDGTDLATRVAERRYPPGEAARMVAALAEALHYAHTRGVVHRDIKPGNILIDESGRPYIMDFGLALPEQELGRDPGYFGTPAYMSPEQAQGEGHRVDGRSDIFSLGVVLYELLTGRQPFRGKSASEIINLITSLEPRPPRQIVDSIPRELERICLRAMAKRAADRYTTAKDLAADLRHFLGSMEATATQEPAPPDAERTLAQSGANAYSPAAAPAARPSSGGAFEIVPKGLHAFDEHDAEFFLELLPGPRDRHGLPECVRFWKTRIDPADSEKTFPVGLIYGPSGCGKSSLVKAGLIPRLSERVIAVYVEASPDETEARLLGALQARCAASETLRFPSADGAWKEPAPAESPPVGLKESLAALRRGKGVLSGPKVVIILDQFEQWLNAHHDGARSELVQALRQCDGAQAQCLVLVRDDFYVAVNRFFHDLEIPIREGYNYALVDLFDADHARKVLAAFGRAYGKLPGSESQLTSAQRRFLDQSVAALSEEGRVICVRLALFAEMMKDRPWTPDSLRGMGGAEGVGVTFLERTFAAPTASPAHRLHQHAARAVLASLLPEGGTNIKGRLQSLETLREVSGYARRPDDFRALMDILERELRLIAPTEFESAAGDVEESKSRRAKEEASTGPTIVSHQSSIPPAYYQLTHEFLIPALQDWLTRKQKETCRGRAELRLSERTVLWTGKPERKQLPSFLEWLSIRLWTRRRAWSARQQSMMRVATRHHLRRLCIALGLVMVMAGAALVAGRYAVEQARQYRVQNLVRQLWKVDIEHLPALLDQLDEHREMWHKEVKAAVDDPATDPDRRNRGQLALARRDPSLVEDLSERLLVAGVDEHRVIRDELKRWHRRVTSKLWKRALDGMLEAGGLLRAASALADYAADSDHWESVAPRVARALVKQDPLVVGPWIEALSPVRGRLRGPLTEAFSDASAGEGERLLAASVLARYATADADFLNRDRLARLMMDADRAQYAVLLPLARSRGADFVERMSAALETAVPLLADDQYEREIQRQANAAATLLRLGHAERFWPLLKQSEDPRLRTRLIDRISRVQTGWKEALARLDGEADGTVRAAIILGLEPSGRIVSEMERRTLSKRLLGIFETDPDGGVHSAAEWVLTRWGLSQQLEGVKRRLAGSPANGRKWFINSQLQTMLIIEAPGVFRMGSPEHEPGRDRSENLREVEIDYTFAISAHEVTLEQFRHFRPDVPQQSSRPEPKCPINFVSWYDAARYCRWLSEREEIPEDQQCYPPPSSIGPMMELPADYLRRAGYRLPTAAEWEYAARAGAVTSRFFGNAESLLDQYAWYAVNSAINSVNRTWPVGRLRPNPLGLFDVYGNVKEWCGPAGSDDRRFRGGGYRDTPKFLRSAMSESNSPDTSLSILGFRIVKAIPIQQSD